MLFRSVLFGAAAIVRLESALHGGRSFKDASVETRFAGAENREAAKAQATDEMTKPTSVFWAVDSLLRSPLHLVPQGFAGVFHTRGGLPHPVDNYVDNGRTYMPDI